MAESGDGITGLSLDGVRKLIEDKNLPEDLLDAFNLISGAAIALSPIVLGPAGAAVLWPLLEPKNDLIDAAKTAIRKLTKAQPRDYIDQARRFAAANTLLTYTAFFDALSMCTPDLLSELKITEEEKALITALAADQVLGTLSQPASGEPILTDVIKIPHPVAANDIAATEFRLNLYQRMAIETYQMITSSQAKPGRHRKTPSDTLRDRVAALAESVYQAEFLGMAIDYQPFSTWATLQDQADKGALLRKLSDDLRVEGKDSHLRFKVLDAAIHNLDRGLDRLFRAIDAQPLSSPDGPRLPDSKAAKAAQALQRRYDADVRQPVIDDRYAPPAGGPRLKYPGSAAAYVPQAYRQVRYAVGETHLEREEDWQKLAAADDLGPAITRYLESPYSAESPLLILGHPGSGKSLLTRVYAARLRYPRYTVVRVELRDANPTVSIQKQVEDQIRKDTGYDVNWADLADNLPFSPPIVILDGYDELLQATGKLFTDYLDQVQRFQRDALVQRRPVRVIVTSRITLIDKAIIPPGTTVMRLEPFDEPRRTEWITRWNACNATYFQQSGVKPFRLPDNQKLVDLSEQPLLLLMLSIFDSAANALSDRPDLDQTQLYDELLRRFIEREIAKGKGAAFLGLLPEERRPLVDCELTRLGVAAIGMFNRQEVKILRDQLDKDLAYFDAERKPTANLYGQSQSEILLGSFFFIHESRSRLTTDGTANGTQPSAISGKPGPATGPTAFEFLHNTFGEFLAADFILKQVIENAETIRDLTGKPSLERTRQQHLASLTPYWFASLLYTPLHTRPNILALLHEWSVHCLPATPTAREELLSSLDEIVRTQLRTLLVGTDPLDLAARARSATPSQPTPTSPPYDPLPVLGHVSVYTLNLILLRTYLADRAYDLDESALDAGDHPWDRLAALWRSWFTPESLGTLATQFTATRTENQLTLEPAKSMLRVEPTSSLHAAYNAAIALADDLTAESMGLHVISLMPMVEASQYFLPRLINRFDDETRPLALITDSVRRRLEGYHPELSAAVLAKLTRSDLGTSGLMLDFAEFTNRAVLAPWQRIEIAMNQGDLMEMTTLSRYASTVITHLCAERDAEWLYRMLTVPSEYGESPEVWPAFLWSPAAAPVFRASVARLTAVQCVQVADLIRGMLPDGEITIFDVDTATALAVLAWRGSDEELCARAIDAILNGCANDGWNLLDIPLETWDGLATLFVEAGPAMASRRREFAAVLDGYVESLMPFQMTYPVPADKMDLRHILMMDFADRALPVPYKELTELSLHAFRIGSASHRERFLPLLIPIATGDTGSQKARRQFLLLLRWARENDETQFVRELLLMADSRDVSPWWTHFGAWEDTGPEAIDFDRASADLTYREAMDLRWALDLWRESGAHQSSEPADPTSPGTPTTPAPPTKRRRLHR